MRNSLCTLLTTLLLSTLLSGCIGLGAGGPYGYIGGHMTGLDNKNSPQYDGDADECNPGFSLGVGMPLAPFVSVEAGYTKFGQTSFDGTWTIDGIPSTDVGTIDGWGITAGGVGRLPVPGRFTPLAKVGVIRWKLSEDEVFAGVPESHEADGVDPYFGLGVEIDLPSVLAFRAGWDHFTGIGKDGETGRGAANQFSAGFVARLK